VKPAVGFTLPSAGVTPAPAGRKKRRCGTSSLLELVSVRADPENLPTCWQRRYIEIDHDTIEETQQ
jgi:hypothetical protein